MSFSRKILKRDLILRSTQKSILNTTSFDENLIWFYIILWGQHYPIYIHAWHACHIFFYEKCLAWQTRKNKNNITVKMFCNILYHKPIMWVKNAQRGQIGILWNLRSNFWLKNLELKWFNSNSKQNSAFKINVY